VSLDLCDLLTHKLNLAMTGQKLRVYREFRNYSQEYIAEKLGITQNAYSRIETNQTRITAERLRQIADILSIPFSCLLSDSEPELNFGNGSSDKHATELLEYTKLLYDQIIKTKDEKIISLEDEICNLRKDRDKMMQLIEKLT
jgi:transcriptional regulator with XRE-family HTH domain